MNYIDYVCANHVFFQKIALVKHLQDYAKQATKEDVSMNYAIDVLLPEVITIGVTQFKLWNGRRKQCKFCLLHTVEIITTTSNV